MWKYCLWKSLSPSPKRLFPSEKSAVPTERENLTSDLCVPLSVPATSIGDRSSTPDSTGIVFTFKYEIKDFPKKAGE